MSYVVAILLIGFLILVHELGHFVMARFVGIPIARFSVGFGPGLYGFHRGETEYCLSAIPLGGYVLPVIEDEDQFFRLPALRRLVFFAGGPLANLLLAVPLFATLNVLSDGFSLASVTITPIIQAWNAVGQLLACIPKLFTQPDAVMGVVGIVVEGGAFVGLDLERAIQFTILLSLNLAILNLLPIPVLDGGKILLLAAERWLPQPRQLHLVLSIVGWLLIAGLMLYATAMDIGRYALG
jgi:regulator of sigma E protease